MMCKAQRNSLIFACLIVLLFILTGCSSTSAKGVYRAYLGDQPRESELATIDMGAAYEAIVDDMYYVSRGKHATVKVIAGIHKIKWATIFGVSVMVEPQGHAVSAITSKINFEPGHVYKLSADRTTGHGYKVFSWVEDTTAGRIVCGEKKP